MSRENHLSPYWQTAKEYLATLPDPRLAMAFIKSHSDQELQTLAQSLGIEVPKTTTADTLDNIANHAGVVGFTALPIIAALAFALPLHGMAVPALPFNYTDYAIYNGLCGLNIAAMGSRIQELNSILAKTAQDETQQKEATTELKQLQKKQAALKQQKIILWSMLSAIAAGITAYLVTSPDTKILSATASAHAAGPAGIALGFIFVGIMTTLAVLEAKQATAAEKRVKILETRLEDAIAEYNTEAQKKDGRGEVIHPNKLKIHTEKVNALTNLLYFEKAQAAKHKTDSLLLAGTATALGGSAIAGTTFMVMAIVGASIAGGAVTMGALPLAFGLICAAISLYRWYRSIHPAETKPMKNAADNPMTSKEFEQEKNRTSNWAGLFNEKPALSANAKKSDLKSNEETPYKPPIKYWPSPTK